MCTSDKIEAFDGRKLTPEQWEHRKRSILWRAQAARAQALRDVAGGILAMSLTIAVGGRDVVRNWWSAYAIRRERKAAIRELGALDDRTLKDIGLGRSEIESVIHDPERLAARNFATARYHKPAARSGENPHQPIQKSAVEEGGRRAGLRADLRTDLGRLDIRRPAQRANGYLAASAKVARKECAG